jgi:hypothetical protein
MRPFKYNLRVEFFIHDRKIIGAIIVGITKKHAADRHFVRNVLILLGTADDQDAFYYCIIIGL